jgi:glycine/D-amino acid oxidase-like deaminating enzyme
VVETENIACHFERCGRLIVAASEKQERALLDELELKRRHLGEPYEPLAGPALRAAFPSNRFVGGAIVPDLGSIHPGLYHLGLLSRAQEAGVTVLARTLVTEIAAEEPGFRLATSHGSAVAREVVLATNGYTGRGAPPFLRRRLIPFDAYMIATERLPAETVRALLPTNRTVIDCNHNIIYLRRSPDGARILFGGQTGARTRNLKSRAAALHRLATKILPGFGDLRLSYAWTGRCAGTFDLYPHVGRREGIWYAAGYCFAGVPMGTYLGRKVAWQILGDPRGATVFADRGFRTIPLYDGKPWFVPYAMACYNLLDARAGGSLR